MGTDTYNGWTNRATWLVNLHLSNDHGLYLHTREVVAEGWAHGIDTFGTVAADWPTVDLEPEGFARRGAADALRALVDDLADVTGSDASALLVSDLIGTALADVDWLEIADGWLDDLAAEGELAELPERV